MYKNRIQNIIIHESNNNGNHAFADRVSEFHMDIIERRLKQSGLAAEQQICIIDKIAANLKLQEVNGIIK